MICRSVFRIQMCDGPRILQNENRRTQDRGDLVNWSVGLFPVPVHAAQVRCVEELLGSPENEVIAWRSFELCCPWSTIRSVYGENDECEADDEGDGRDIGIRA